ncbi:MAG: general secretion pathway protein GspG [Acidobacteria bacterium]|nr:MAG: general secretion pathway protein GspG [Acidobacteriota bacterium]
MNLNFAKRSGVVPRVARNNHGFTMMELMVVIAIILVLIGMAAGRYEKSVVRAREAVLKQDLQTMRSAIQQFTLDKAAGPQSLDDLVSAGYLREVPTDPMTRAREWHTDSDNVLLSVDQTSPGITDVHSTSDTVSPFENTPYSSW